MLDVKLQARARGDGVVAAGRGMQAAREVWQMDLWPLRHVDGPGPVCQVSGAYIVHCNGSLESEPVI